jgi:hypothetical protein
MYALGCEMKNRTALCEGIALRSGLRPTIGLRPHVNGAAAYCRHALEMAPRALLGLSSNYPITGSFEGLHQLKVAE